MAQNILLIGGISQYQAMFFFDQLKEADEKEPGGELNLRVNSEGGSPEYSQSIIQIVQEESERFYLKYAACAHSTALFLMAYVPAEKVECLDTTQGVLHRAAYPDWIEDSSWYPGSVYETVVTKINRDLEKAFRARVDVAALEALPAMADKGLKLKDIFATDARIEVVLTGADMKKIGLVGKVTKITPTRAAAEAKQIDTFNKCRTLEEFKAAAAATKPAKKPDVEETEDEPTASSKTDNIMNLQELKEKHPTIYAEAVKLGKKIGARKERERVDAVMVFAEQNPKKVKEIIASGKPMTAAQTMELMLQAQGKAALGKIAADAAPDVTTEDTEGADAKAKAESFLAKALPAVFKKSGATLPPVAV